MDAGPSVSRLATVNNDARPTVQTSVASSVQLSGPKGPRASSVPLVPSELTVGVVYSTEMTSHFSLQDHPEQPARISHIWHTLIVNKCNTKMKWLPIRPVHKQEALLVHSEDHWDKVHAIQYMTPQQIVDSEAYYETLSLYVMQGTTRSALLSCGGVIEACLAVAASDSSLKKALAIVRPPGHHAEPNEHMGFCFFNNVSVAARVVQERLKLKRILILDWDVHHGNGTQKAFNNDPTVLYISLHRYEDGQFYPCGTFGGMQSCGEGPGLGFSVNIPWPEKGMKDADYIHAFQKIVMPIAMEFAPQLVIISAGFDAAEGDELGECHVSPAGYAHMTHMLSGLASGKVVVALEGGYNINAIAKSALAVTQVLLGEAPPELLPMTAGESATETVWLVAKEQSKYWKSVDPKACEPRKDFERATFSIPEILKAHRQHYLFTSHDMMQIPLLSDYLDDRFSMQIMCTPDLLDNKTMVIFIHEFGNLRTELESSATCNLELERSYLVDFSKDFIVWVKKQGYSLLDINQFPKPFAAPTRRSQTPKDPTKEVLVYLWDNYVQLSNAERVVLVGHGPGCHSMIDLVDHRWMLGNKLVKAVVQVVGNSKVPTVPKSDEFKAWYSKHSLVAVPSSHPVYGSTSQGKRDLRRHHHVIAIDETQPIKLIIKALPAIQDYVQMELARYPLKKRNGSDE
ncbi:histone deacetylase complex protein [Armillaria luteobubalina]|uniref:histone deacetylase n=1 Tax=Armillaria luteobubalina TaxID=153913 RepID=A0AA39UZH4_9AGAR|nr:histone deacetylase complex protein [Armillaria luteobubalina]